LQCQALACRDVGVAPGKVFAFALTLATAGADGKVRANAPLTQGNAHPYARARIAAASVGFDAILCRQQVDVTFGLQVRVAPCANVAAAHGQAGILPRAAGADAYIPACGYAGTCRHVVGTGGFAGTFTRAQRQVAPRYKGRLTILSTIGDLRGYGDECVCAEVSRC